jgi:predicted enzyme related to lactoylglutathione lyase
MRLKLELVPLPVSDVERSIAFYGQALGFSKDVDVRPADGVRVVQFTPDGSGCSIGFGTGLDVYAGEPGSVRGLHLVVKTSARRAPNSLAAASRSARSMTSVVG